MPLASLNNQSGGRSLISHIDCFDSPETKDTKTGNHCGASESSFTPLIHDLEGCENVIGVGSRLAELSESMSVNIEAKMSGQNMRSMFRSWA